MRTFLLEVFILLSGFLCIKAQNNIEMTKSERIYIHTDREVYLAGDNLFYKLYLQGNTDNLSKYAYLVIRNTDNGSISNLLLEITKQSAFGHTYIPDTLRTGVYQIVCFTNSMRNDGEDSYFTKEILVVNRFDKDLLMFNNDYFDKISTQNSNNQNTNENLLIHLDKSIYGSREKVTFSVEPKEINGDSIMNLSVSVGEIVPEIPYIKTISNYFDKQNKSEPTTENREYSSAFHPELKEVSIQGKLMFKKELTNISDIDIDKKIYTILVSTPDSITNMQFTRTDSTGTFHLFLNRYYYGKELIIRTKENVDARIELDHKFKLEHPFIPSDLFLSKSIKTSLIRSMNIAEARSYYDEKKEIGIQITSSPVKTIPRVYYIPDFKIIPADFMPLDNFVEISRELLPALRIRKNNDSYILNCFDPKNQISLNLNPVIFLDGVPIDDVNQIINLKSNQIKSIDILPVRRYYGEMSLSGILSVFSKAMEINNTKFKTPTIRYLSLSSQNQTKSRNFNPENTNNKIPDLRQLLFWDPEITIHSKEKMLIEFYTSDLQGNYLIKIQGITSKGLPLNGSAIIHVKSNSNQ